jgi:hypothetical protein
MPSGVWRHFVIKMARGSAFGSTKGRRQVWLAWWQSRKGVRGNLNGWRFVAALDKLPAKPTDRMNLPFYPSERDRRRAQRG